MAQYLIDERDMMFNLKECPGLAEIQKIEKFADCDADMLDMVFEQSKSFSQKIMAPLLAPSDREGCSCKDGEVQLPAGMAEAWRQYRELGIIGITAPVEFGGSGLPHFFSIPVGELEAGSFISFALLPLLTRGAARLIFSFGSQSLKEIYLEKMFSGDWSGTMCLTEPGAGSDVGSGITKAEPEDDHYKITGTKIFITWGEHNLAENIVHLVLARIQGAPPGSKGLSLFVVPKFLSDENGKITSRNDVFCSNIEHKLGINASPTCTIQFGTEGKCVGYLVGGSNQGLKYMFQMMNEARMEVGIQSFAQASSAYLSALDYSRERVQGNITGAEGTRPAKIIEHPDVKQMLLKMRAIVEGCRSLTYHLVQFLDLSHHHPTDSKKYEALVDLLTPICKSYCSDQGFRVAEMAIQTHGGYGYCQEYPAEQYLRDLKISSIYEGTNGIQALDLVFRKILMNRGEYLKVWLAEAESLAASLENTELAPLGDQLLGGTEELVQTVAHFGTLYAGGEEERIQFVATDFQENMGHLLVGYFLLRQSAHVLVALAGDINDRDKAFYLQKLVTTRYFFQHILHGGVQALAHLRAEEEAGLAVAFL